MTGTPTSAIRNIDLRFPPKLDFLFRPARYKVAYGGRGSAKSWNFARALLILGAGRRPLRILCAREFQVSIQESVHQLLADQIEAMGLSRWYSVQQAAIYGYQGTKFIFSGIRSNPTKIKSTEGVDICWIEEAEKVSEKSWEIVIPTIRKSGSEIWVSFNPDEESDATYQRFVTHKPPGSVVRYMTWRDNPWFPESLARERDYLARVDPDAHAHIWDGLCNTRSDAQVLRGKWSVEHFDPAPEWDGPYQGADWGFSSDPTTLVRCWVHERRLYVSHEAYGVGVDIDKTPEMFDTIPGARDFVTRADSARPETVSYMQRHGYQKICSVPKWQGSVEDGVTFLRGFERIVIHPRCRHTADEARLWKYKVNQAGDVLPMLAEGNEHCWDAIRYALQPLIKAGGNGLFEFMAAQAAAKQEQQQHGS